MNVLPAWMATGLLPCDYSPDHCIVIDQYTAEQGYNRLCSEVGHVERTWDIPDPVYIDFKCGHFWQWDLLRQHLRPGDAQVLHAVNDLFKPPDTHHSWWEGIDELCALPNQHSIHLDLVNRCVTDDHAGLQAVLLNTRFFTIQYTAVGTDNWGTTWQLRHPLVGQTFTRIYDD